MSAESDGIGIDPSLGKLMMHLEDEINFEELQLLWGKWASGGRAV